MTTNLSDSEREVWKDLYKLHEKYHDMQGTEQDWLAFAADLGIVSCRYSGRDQRLCDTMMVALYDWFSEEQKLRQDTKREAVTAEQVQLEEIPWT